MKTVGIYANWKGGGLSVVPSLSVPPRAAAVPAGGGCTRKRRERREKRESQRAAAARAGGRRRALKLAMTRTDNPLGSVYLEYNIYLNANQ